MSRPHSRGVLLSQLRLRAGLAAEGVRGARGIEGSGVASKSSLSHDLISIMFVNDLSFRMNADENQNLLGQALWQIDGASPLVGWLWILDRSIKRHSR